MIARCSALAAAVAIVTAGIWSFGLFGGNPEALASVQEKVSRTQSVAMTLTSLEGDHSKPAGKGYAMADGRLRVEQPDGAYTVIDPKAEISLAVDPKAKTALLIRGYHNRLPADIYHTIRNIQKGEVRKLPVERIDGRDAEVFIATVKLSETSQEITVWVNPKTRLPIRLAMADLSADAKAKRILRIDLEFDTPLDAKLFSTAPPERFAVRTLGIDKPLQPAKDGNLQAPTVTAGEGIGPVKFGMSAKEVIEKLGEPDQKDKRGMALDYLSRGYSIHVSPQRGVFMILCNTQATFAIKVKDFAGKTKEGIAMGAASGDILKAYGPPDEKSVEDGTVRLSYRKKLGLEFTLFNDRLVAYSLSMVKKK